MIKVPHPETGEEIEVFTPEEVAEKDASIAAKEAELAEAHNKIAEAEKFRAEQTQNFKKLNELTAEEKAKLTASEIEAKTRAEKLEAELEAMKTGMDADKQAAITARKESSIKRWVGDDAALRAKLEENMKLLNIEDPDALVEKAAQLTGIYVPGATPSPLHQEFNGTPPMLPKKDDEKEAFMKSDKAAAALRAMGMEPKKEEGK